MNSKEKKDKQPKANIFKVLDPYSAMISGLLFLHY
jgi:hypothetical protein